MTDDLDRNYDIDRLSRQKYLLSDEAAFYLGYTRPKYKNPRVAFMQWVRRMGERGPAPCYRGSRVLFLRADLDRHVQTTREAAIVLHQGPRS